MDTKVLWAAYSKTDPRNPFGRHMIGYAGWHADATSALAAAIERNPEWDADDIEVNRA